MKTRCHALIPVAMVAMAMAHTSLGASWEVDPAAVRLTVKITQAPVPRSAGAIVHVPDGGVLPRPGPGLTAVDSGGRRLKSAVLWHDPDRGAVLLIEQPAEGDTVRIYAQQTASPSLWSPTLGLTPGMFAVVATGEGDISTARRIAGARPPGPGTAFTRLAEPALGGHPKAKPGAFSAYIWGHLLCDDPGSTWVAPLGPVETLLDGHGVPRQRQSEKSGGTGSSVLLAAGPHRLQMFHHNSGTRDDAMRLAWRLPGTPDKELAPGRDGVPDWDARPVRKEECAQSGSAKLMRVERRDGRLVAAFSAIPLRYFLFSQNAVVQYELKALDPGKDSDSTYTWLLPGGARVQAGPRITWIMEATGDQTVALQVARGERATRCKRTFDTAVPGARRAHITSADDRRAFRETFLAMLQSTPGGRTQMETWTPAMWDLLLRLNMPSEGEQLLKATLVDHPDLTAGAMIPGQLQKLEGLYFLAACPSNPETVLKWIDSRRAAETVPARLAMWHLRRAEVRMFYLDKQDAEVQADLAAARRGGGSITMWGRIREGDLALLRGDAESALAIYGRIQDDVTHSDVVSPKSATPAEPSKRSRVEQSRKRSREEWLARRRAFRAGASATEPREDEIADWRIGAIRDTATSETARYLIKQGYHEEAMALLAKWEMEFPLSKLTGDYFVVEAMLRIAMGDAKRADTILAAYCSAVDMTNSLPEAMKLRLVAMKMLGRDKTTLADFVKDMKKRFPDHPVVAQAESLL